MSNGALNNLNWVDILMGVILLRVVFIGLKRGFVIEIFKILGLAAAAFVTLHYFNTISRVLQEKINLAEGLANGLVFGCLWFAAVVVFKLFRDGILLLFKVEAHSAIHRWGGVLMAVGRGLLIGSLTVLLLHVARFEYFEKNLEKSLTASRLVPIAPRVYEGVYNIFVSKFFPQEELDKTAAQLGSFGRGETEK